MTMHRLLKLDPSAGKCILLVGAPELDDSLDQKLLVHRKANNVTIWLPVIVIKKTSATIVEKYYAQHYCRLSQSVVDCNGICIFFLA